MKTLALILSLLLTAVAGAMLIKNNLTSDPVYIYLALTILGASLAAFGIGYGEYYKEKYERAIKAKFNQKRIFSPS